MHLLCTQVSNKVSRDTHILKLKNILSRIQHHIDSFLVGELTSKTTTRGKKRQSNKNQTLYDKVNEKIDDLILSQAFKILNSKSTEMDPEITHQALKDHMFKKIEKTEEEQRSILQPLEGHDFKATVKMVKQAILLSKSKRVPGVDGITAQNIKS